MIEVTKFTDAELFKLKELSEYSRTILHKNCASRKHCDGCTFQRLCIYYRDLTIISNKELKRRCS